jgi:hypothetical protein
MAFDIKVVIGCTMEVWATLDCAARLAPKCQKVFHNDPQLPVARSSRARLLARPLDNGPCERQNADGAPQKIERIVGRQAPIRYSLTYSPLIFLDRASWHFNGFGFRQCCHEFAPLGDCVAHRDQFG